MPNNKKEKKMAALLLCFNQKWKLVIRRLILISVEIYLHDREAPVGKCLEILFLFTFSKHVIVNPGNVFEERELIF